jgi:hypothetical protein
LKVENEFLAFRGNATIAQEYMDILLLEPAQRHIVGKGLPFYDLIKDNWSEVNEMVWKNVVDQTCQYVKEHIVPMPGYLNMTNASVGPMHSNRFVSTRELYESPVFAEEIDMMLRYPEMGWFDVTWVAVKTELLDQAKVFKKLGPRVFLPQGRMLNAMACYLFRGLNDQLKGTPLYRGGFNFFNGGVESFRAELAQIPGYYHEEDAKKFDLMYLQFVITAVREVRKSGILRQYHKLVDHYYDFVSRNPVCWKNQIVVVEQCMASGQQNTSTDNSIRNFLRWIYVIMMFLPITLYDILSMSELNIFGDDSLNKLPWFIPEDHMIKCSAQVGIVSKGWTVQPDKSLIGKSFIGLRFMKYSYHWDIRKLYSSCKYRGELTLEQFQSKIEMILLLLYPIKHEFNLVYEKAVEYFRPYGMTVHDRRFFRKFYVTC